MFDRKFQFKKEYPNSFLLSDDVETVGSFLKDHSFIDEDTALLSLEKPGEGNMNYVLRAKMDDGSSFIIKQSRPWVEKYNQIDAPIDRILVERTYYERISKIDLLNSYSPQVLGVDKKSRIMIIEDLGEASDLTSVYKTDETFSQNEINSCIEYLNYLVKINDLKGMPSNIKMRKLNHQHIFNLPLVEDNGFNLDDIQQGLQAVSKEFKSDDVLKQRIAELGDVYLGNGNVLVHGDFYPGSILKTKNGIHVIDPEFSFIGPSEWDIAIFIAHLLMAKVETDEAMNIFTRFEQSIQFNMQQFSGFVGTEIIRRIIGLAQLPLTLSLNEKHALLLAATKWVKKGEIS